MYKTGRPGCESIPVFFALQEKMQNGNETKKMLRKHIRIFQKEAPAENGKGNLWNSYKNFIKRPLFRIYFVHKPFTEVNIHPSEVNFATFFLGKRML